MTSSAARTVGVEEEMLLFTADGETAAPVGEELHQDDTTEVEHELKLEQAEIASPPTADLAALAAHLRAARAELVEAAARRHLSVAALGTSPLRTRSTPTPDERYARMQERYQGVVSDQLTCGAHVHVGVDSRAEGVTALDGVRAWLPVLLALAANSPFWDGADTGYASFRSIAWGRWPSAGPTDEFGDEAAYDARLAALVDSGASIDDAMVYFDARLSATYPTVEFRVADVGQEVDDEVLLAALCRAAVDTAVAGAAERPPGPEVALLRAASWRAARYGLTDTLYDAVERRVRPAAAMLDRMVETFTPALTRSGDLDLVRAGLDRVLACGTGAELQRADLVAGGGAGAVVRAAALRL